MKKSAAIELFGGIRATAKAVDISWNAVNKWPAELSKAVTDRVIAALAREGRYEDVAGLVGVHDADSGVGS